jgi:hypothetical protein
LSTAAMLIPLGRLLWRAARAAARVLRWPARLLWPHLPPGLTGWLAQRWAKVSAFFRARFEGTTLEERWGYAVWGAMGVMVAVPELTAAFEGSSFVWPTISSTIGHLEDFAPVVALFPVSIIVIGAYSLFVVRPSDSRGAQLLLGRTPAAGATNTPPDTFTEVSRDAYGRATKRVFEPGAGDVPSSMQVPPDTLPVDPYFTAVTVLIVVAAAVASLSHDRWSTAYVLYAPIAVFWIIVPAALAYWWKRGVPFLTLFLTMRRLEGRLHLVAYLFAAGLAVLLVHLALYPWPNLAHNSSRYAGVTPGDAQERAEQSVAAARKRVGGRQMKVATKIRSVVNEREAWIVYFETQAGGRTGCRVVISSSTDMWRAPSCGSSGP